jgi:hypothetical protein
MKCRLCCRGPQEIKGWLARMNPVGELPAVWECRPSCDAELSEEEAVLGAVDGEVEEQRRGGSRGGSQ